MILWIILLVIAIIVLFVLWWFLPDDSDIEVDHHPTVHARCQSDGACGGDLTCDLKCNRCRKKLEGDCSADNDCESGLKCHNWKCIRDDSNAESSETNIPIQKKKRKGVRWDETKNETRYF